jgi:hypothetical protein
LFEASSQVYGCVSHDDSNSNSPTITPMIHTLLKTSISQQSLSWPALIHRIPLPKFPNNILHNNRPRPQYLQYRLWLLKSNKKIYQQCSRNSWLP